MIHNNNDAQKRWESVIRNTFNTFPISLANTGTLSIDEAIGFEREIRDGEDPYAMVRITKLEQLMGISTSSNEATIRDSDLPAFLFIKHGIINIAPENRNDFWLTDEGNSVLAQFASDLASFRVPGLNYNQRDME